MLSVVLRLMIAMLCGGLVGLERGRKHRAAGFRTYMLVCVGAALTMLLGQYLSYALMTTWQDTVKDIGMQTDVSRFGAQVINGIGFLGAGTIIVTGRQQVKGLTTAAGLWASACMGLAVGAGYFECVSLAFVLIYGVMRLLPAVENLVINHARNINIYVEFTSLDNLGEVIDRIKKMNVQIYEVDIDRGSEEINQYPSAVFFIHMTKKMQHTKLITNISNLSCIRTVDEI